MKQTEAKPSLLPAVTPIEFNVLVSLLDGEQHGLGLIQEIAARTNNELFLAPGTLYPALKRMDQAGWITLTTPTKTAVDDERRRYHRLTARGRAMIVAEVERMERVARLTRDMLGPQPALEPPEPSVSKSMNKPLPQSVLPTQDVSARPSQVDEFLAEAELQANVLGASRTSTSTHMAQQREVSMSEDILARTISPTMES